LKINYFTCDEGNFGDDLNEWIWDRLIPGWRQWDHDVTLLGVGTLINDRLIDELRDANVLILGTGVGYGDDILRASIPENWDIKSVRGPNSARQLGISETRGLIDPAVMVADFPEFQDQPKSDIPIFIPHHKSVNRHDWSKVCDRHRLQYVSPTSDSIQVIKSIAGAPLVITESMHGAIIADSFRVPWLPIRISPKFNAEKWIDVLESVGLDLEVPFLFPKVEKISKMCRQPRLRRLQRRIRILYESVCIDDALHNVLQSPPFLGNIEEMERRKLNYSRVLEEVRKKYA
jgi:succinoglycan biosynthesis protein ExoV